MTHPPDIPLACARAEVANLQSRIPAQTEQGSVTAHGRALPLGKSFAALVIGAALLGVAAATLAPPAAAVPGPEVEYTYNVIVRRHFDFPNNDAIGYGFGICDKVTRGDTYDSVLAQVKNDVVPNDEQAANYVVSNAVGILCPAQIWQLRNSARHYQPQIAS